MAWYLAPSLSVLRNEVNTRWPGRDKTSDGTIGDDAHQQRPSDHNPNERESVDAWDMDKDGVDVWEVIEAFQRHPSAHYWIWNRQIADRDTGWARRTYTGDNPHTLHVHFSIRQTEPAEQDRRAWGLLEDDMDFRDGGDGEALIYRIGALINGSAVVGGGPTKGERNVLHEKLNSIIRTQQTLAAAEASRDAALRSLVEQLAAAVAAGGGSVDTAAILAGVDAAVAAARADLRDAVADLGEGGAAQVRADQA